MQVSILRDTGFKLVGSNVEGWELRGTDVNDETHLEILGNEGGNWRRKV